MPFQPTGTNIVTNTAPTPGVRMRVVRTNGETANMVGLGEDLQLRIEIDQDSAFGLFARKLEARTDNGELMNLIDDSGCPVNELIFPALELESNTRALYADFKAFRFPSTPIVNFIATVQFCQELCEPVSFISKLFFLSSAVCVACFRSIINEKRSQCSNTWKKYSAKYFQRKNLFFIFKKKIFFF